MPDAITPYNFVPLDRIVEVLPDELPEADRYHSNRHTGYFDIEIETLTPTYTRGARKVSRDFPDPIANASDRNLDGLPADFFHRGDNARTPVLPGSSLRGMIRNVFEVVTFSRINFVSERRLFYRGIADSKQSGKQELYKAGHNKDWLLGGILEKTDQGMVLRVSTSTPKGFVLVENIGQAARDFNQSRNQVHAVTVKLLDGETHTIIGAPIAQIITRGHNSKQGLPGWLIVPGPDINKRHWWQVILMPEVEATDDYQVPADVYSDYLTWGEMAFGAKFNDRSLVQRDDGRMPRKLVIGAPAFALRSTEEPQSVQVIGANMMMAVRYGKSLAAIADGFYSRYYGDRQTPQLDMAQAVFGRVSEHNRILPMIRGRVFFEDAVCITPNPWLAEQEADSVKIPSILSGPKPTSCNVYAALYDGQKVLKARTHWNDENVTIRGFKRYTHRSDIAASNELGWDQGGTGTQKTRIRPVKKQVVFRGRVRFENMSAAELGALYASIQLPSGLAHKFGMAKNLGLGSVRVKVTQTTLFDPVQRYHSFTKGAGIRQDNAVVLETCYRAFVQFLFKKDVSLWRSLRMQALAALLWWEDKGRLPDSITRQVSIQNEEHPYDRQWKDGFLLEMANQMHLLYSQRGSDANLNAQPDDIFPILAVAPQPVQGNPIANPQPAQKYKGGETVNVKILTDPGLPPIADVEVQDGSGIVVKNQAIRMGLVVGSSLKMKVSTVDNNGKITRLKA